MLGLYSRGRSEGTLKVEDCWQRYLQADVDGNVVARDQQGRVGHDAVGRQLDEAGRVRDAIFRNHPSYFFIEPTFVFLVI